MKNKEPPKKLCPECGERYLKFYQGQYTLCCIACGSSRAIRLRKENNLNIGKKKCIKCGNLYEGDARTKFCHNPCTHGRKKSIKELNQSWLK